MLRHRLAAIAFACFTPYLGLGCIAEVGETESFEEQLRGVASDQDALVFDAKQFLHTVKGFGTHVWAGDVAAERVVQELELDYVRMAACPEWPRLSVKAPTDA